MDLVLNLVVDGVLVSAWCGAGARAADAVEIRRAKADVERQGWLDLAP